MDLWQKGNKQHFNKVYIVVTLNMMTSGKNKGLNELKITPINKEQYRKFHLVRKLTSPALGSHQLLSWNQKKYIGKELPVGFSFRSCRPVNSQIFHYSQKANNLYIFPLPGEPLSNLLRSRPGQEIKKWIEKAGEQEDAFLQLIRICLKLHTEQGVDDILMECFRISDDQLLYTYDTWMKKSKSILAENSLQIQNYFLTAKELQILKQEGVGQQDEQVSYSDFLFKLGLMVLNLGVPEVKIRNYQYCQYSLNKRNINEKLRLFQMKYCRKNLANLVQQFIGYKFKTMQDLWHLFESQNKNKGLPGHLIGESAENSLNKSLSKSFIQKQNSLYLSKKCDRRSSAKKLHDKSLNSLILQNPSQRKVKLKARNYSKLSESVSEISAVHDRTVVSPQGIDLKSLLSNIKEFNSCMELIDYLGISEYVPKSSYEDKIINVFEGVHIKQKWEHKVYPNGSIYWGELQNGKRHKMGLYLFDSHDLYYGQWDNNFMSGKGTYVFKSGESYSGELINGLKNGFGQFYYKDGRVFQGNWLDNNKVGLGSVTFPTGVKFTGLFKKQPETEGIFTKILEDSVIQYFGILQHYNWETDSFYNEADNKKNKLKKCKIDVFSTCIDEKGSHYSGQCRQNQPNGFGIKQSDTQIFEGEWKNGRQQGFGVLSVKGRYNIQGTWKEGILIEYSEQ